MCIIVGGAKRNLRIGISQPGTKTKGRAIVRRRVFTHDCVGDSRLVLCPARAI
ncbi:MAG: hypothetical protein LBU34_12885 [Planctomycetaceae bacterium]|nr:hypothetical protein [Planctomycetaceae bacterium]